MTKKQKKETLANILADCQPLLAMMFKKTAPIMVTKVIKTVKCSSWHNKYANFFIVFLACSLMICIAF
jgi:hypothetical protein